MECETLGLKWTCSRLCPSRSGNGVLGGQALRLQRVAVANEVTSICGLMPYTPSQN